MTEQPDVANLKAFIREYQRGGCKIVSLGSGCPCPLCAVDRLVEERDDNLKASQVVFRVLKDVTQENHTLRTIGNNLATALEEWLQGRALHMHGARIRTCLTNWSRATTPSPPVDYQV